MTLLLILSISYFLSNKNHKKGQQLLDFKLYYTFCHMLLPGLFIAL